MPIRSPPAHLAHLHDLVVQSGEIVARVAAAEPARVAWVQSNGPGGLDPVVEGRLVASTWGGAWRTTGETQRGGHRPSCRFPSGSQSSLSRPLGLGKKGEEQQGEPEGATGRSEGEQRGNPREQRGNQKEQHVNQTEQQGGIRGSNRAESEGAGR
eukprot:88534-Chlamydomonas_euryale.AAC.1